MPVVASRFHLSGRLLPALFVLAAGLVPAVPSAAPGAPPATMQAQIARQRAIQRALHDPIALHRDLPRLLRSDRAGAHAARGGGNVTRAAISPYPVPQGGGPAADLYVPYLDIRGAGVGYLAKFDASGQAPLGWAAEGVPLIDGCQLIEEGRALDDGSGGRIAGWREFGFGDQRLFAQRVNASGSRVWGPTGVQVTPDFVPEGDWEMAPDASHGAFFAWLIRTVDGTQVVVQHVSQSGALDWLPSGVTLGLFDHEAADPRLAWDGAGGVYVVWTDLGNSRAYAQHLDASGALLMVPVEGAPVGGIGDFDISPDGTDGLTLAWESYNTTAGNYDIFAQRYDSGGTPTWTDSSVVVCAASGDQSDVRVIPAGGGDVLIAWQDQRSGSVETYAMRLEADGTPTSPWPVDGARVTGLATERFDLIPDGLGGAFVAGQILAAAQMPSVQITLQHLLSNGDISLGYDPDGNVVAPEAAEGEPVYLAVDGGGGVLAAWSQWVSSVEGTQAVPFGQHLDISGAPAWNGGAPLSLLPPLVGRQGAPSVAEGGNGGARVAFLQLNAGNAGLDAGLKRVNSTGAPQGATSPISYGSGPVSPVTLVKSGANQAIALWTEFSDLPPTLRAQRFSPGGAPQWGPGGLTLTAGAPFGAFLQDRIPATPDGQGGVLVGWWSGNDIVVQRVDSTSALLWGAGGATVFQGVYGSFLPTEQSVQPDGNGGAFVVGLVYGDSLGSPVPSWRVQKLDGAGNPLWGTNGVEFANGLLTPDLFSAYITPDASGGVYAVWQVGVFTDDPVHMIRVQHFQSTGEIVAGWPAEGILVRGPYLAGVLAGLAPDGLGNVVVCWMEFRGGHIGAYAQLVTAGGLLQWNGPLANTTNGSINQGVSLALTNGPQVLPLVQTDDSGGAVFAWIEGSGNSWDILAQRITSDGARAWGSSGLAVCNAAGQQGDIALAPDGASGALIAWADGRYAPTDQILMARVAGNGSLPWAGNGVVSTLASLQSAAVVNGVARLAWTTRESSLRARLERRTEGSAWASLGEVSSDGIGWIRAEDATVVRGTRYGYRLVARANGAEEPLGEVWLDVPATLAFAVHGVRPNPANGPLTVSFALPRNAPATLEILDVAGRRVLSREVGTLGAGSHVLNLGDPAGLGMGLYFLRITQGDEQRQARFTRIR